MHQTQLTGLGTGISFLIRIALQRTKRADMNDAGSSGIDVFCIFRIRRFHIWYARGRDSEGCGQIGVDVCSPLFKYAVINHRLVVLPVWRGDPFGP